MEKYCFSVDDPENVPLGTHIRASSAPDACRRIDVGMHRHGRLEPRDLRFFEPLPRLPLLRPDVPDIGDHRRGNQHERNGERYERLRIHQLPPAQLL